MVRAELLRRIGDCIGERTSSDGGDMDAQTVRSIRQDIHEILVDAMSTAKCEHPSEHVLKNKFQPICFVCGRKVSDAQKPTDALAENTSN